MTHEILALLAVLVVWTIWQRIRTHFTQHTLPPGPKLWPIVGNMLDMPTDQPWKQYHDWCEEHESFFIAMAMFSQVQRTAQAELGRVIGRNRLPDFNDVEDLTYLRVVLKVLRRLPVTPFGLAHRVMEDDEYEGYFIPKGAIVTAVCESLLSLCSNDSQDRAGTPERLANITQSTRIPGPRSFQAGKVHWTCPCRYFGSNTLIMTFASVLHVLNVTTKFDKDGHPVKLVPKLANAMVAYVSLRVQMMLGTAFQFFALSVHQWKSRVNWSLARPGRSVLFVKLRWTSSDLSTTR